MDAIKRITTLLVKYLIEKKILMVGVGVGVSAVAAGPAGALAAGAGLGTSEMLTAVGLAVIPSVLLAVIPALVSFRWSDVLRALDNVKRLLTRLLTNVFGSGSGKELDHLIPRIGFQ